MKNQVLFLLSFAILLVLPACRKGSLLESRSEQAPASSVFTLYTIHKGDQYADKRGYRPVSLDTLRFTVKFDSTAIYKTVLAENQYDINKLYGFSDNGSDHHQFSARFGWRWSENALRLFGYVYNNGEMISKEIGSIDIGKEVKCSIIANNNKYIFILNDVMMEMPRSASTPHANGYQLYPYFGGDETAPHDILIQIRED